MAKELLDRMWKKYRDDKGVAQAEVARRVGVTRTTVSEWNEKLQDGGLEALKRRPALKTLFTSGYTENAIVHHGRLDSGVLLLAKPYRKSDLARMFRQALGS